LAALLVVLLLILVLFGVGAFSASLHLLLWIAIIMAVLWLIGFAFRPRGGRWYYW